MAKIQDVVVAVRGFQKYTKEVQQWNEIMQNGPVKGDVEGTIDRIERQSKFLIEEATEVRDGAVLRDVREMLDGFLDTRFVNDQIGVYLESMGVDLVGAWSEVCRSNNSKFSSDYQMLERSVSKFAEQGVEVEIVESPIKYIYVLKRVSDGKIMKPIAFSEPDLRQFIPKELRGEV
jgi:hypothetical protein